MASLQKAAGFKLPTIMPKDPRGNFVWSVYGEPPFKVCFRLTSGAGEYTRMCIHEYVYMYIYTNIHIHIYMYIYIQIGR